MFENFQNCIENVFIVECFIGFLQNMISYILEHKSKFGYLTQLLVSVYFIIFMLVLKNNQLIKRSIRKITIWAYVSYYIRFSKYIYLVIFFLR